MAAFVIASEETGFKATGVSVTVPDYDVCRLSYYLKCGTVSCGLDIIVDELVDFRNAHKLPEARQDAIFRLAYDDFDLEKLANVTIFLDDENQLLPKGTRNEFYEVSKVSNILAIQEDAIIGGQQKQIRKIMVCNQDWLKDFYVNPLQNNSGRLSRILSGGTPTSGMSGMATLGVLLGALLVGAILKDDDDKSNDHCDHCKGGSGECTCKRGCAVKSSTKCSASRNHCSHCKGLDGTCCCEEGCPAKAESLCKVVHSGVMCDSCNSRSIEGARYKCNTCPNYDLCEACYNSGAHNKAHAFERYARVGSTACFLLPREEPVTEAFKAKPSTPEAKPSFAPGRDDVPIAKAVRVEVSSFEKGQLVTLMNMSSNPDMNGTSAVVLQVHGDRVIVEVPSLSKKKITVRPENLQLSYTPFAVGSLVELKDLAKAEMNGLLAVVVEAGVGSAYRLQVKLLDDMNRILRIKPDNLKIVDDFF